MDRAGKRAERQSRDDVRAGDAKQEAGRGAGTRAWLLGALVAGAAFTAHVGTLRAGFVFDDDQFVVQNAYLRSVGDLTRLLTTNIMAGAGLNCNFYRPVQSLTHFLDVQTGGYAAWRHHLTNIVLFALMAAAVYGWLRRFASDWPAFAAAMLFSLHPIQCQAAAFISGRGDILAILFLCVGLACFKSRLWLSCVCAALAILSKESMVVLPAFYALHDAGLERARGSESRSWPSVVLRHAPIWAIAAVYVVLRLSVLNFQGTLDFHGGNNPLSQHPAYRVLTYVTTLPEGMRLWLWPNDLHHGRMWPVYTTIADARVVLSAAGLAAWMGAAAWLWRRKRAVACGMLWFVAATFPTSNLVAVINAIFYDHWFITPGLGLALVAARLLGQVPRRANGAIAGGAALGLGWLSFSLDRTWRDAPTLFAHILRYEPENSRMHTNLGVELCRLGRIGEAIPHFEKSLELNPAQAETHHNLGGALEVTGRLEEARRAYERAIELDPRYFHSWFALGMLDLQQSKFEDAQREFERVVELNPRLAEGYLCIAEAAAQRGDVAAARKALRRGVELTGDERLRAALARTPP